jgi:hypothetical protein
MAAPEADGDPELAEVDPVGVVLPDVLFDDPEVDDTEEVGKESDGVPLARLQNCWERLSACTRSAPQSRATQSNMPLLNAARLCDGKKKKVSWLMLMYNTGGELTERGCNSSQRL